MEPSDRVRAFIHDWHAAWRAQSEASGDDVDFDAWRARVVEVDARHFVAGGGCGSAGHSACCSICRASSPRTVTAWSS